jgi:hypothetical protein
MGQPQEKMLTPGETGSLSLPWKPISLYPLPTEEWESGPEVLLAWPSPHEPSGYAYAVGQGCLREDYTEVYRADGTLPLVPHFTHSSESWECKPTHYCPLYPPGQ